MKLQVLPGGFSVCQVQEIRPDFLKGTFHFLARTDQELSLVCPTESAPADTLRREDGWRAFRVQGPLDFSLVGVLARIAGLLAQGRVSLFALSTFDTDYLLVRREDLGRALALLAQGGFEIEGGAGEGPEDFRQFP